MSRDPILEQRADAFSGLGMRQGYGQDATFWLTERLTRADRQFATYVFVLNEPQRSWDFLGLAGCCGPDVTGPLDATLTDIRTTYGGWNLLKSLKACVKVYNPFDKNDGGWSMAWDILPLYDIGNGWKDASDLFPGVRDGTSSDCDATVAYHDGCYAAANINYLMWGVLNEECYMTFHLAILSSGAYWFLPMEPWSLPTALTSAAAYKGVINKNPGALPEVLSSVTVGYAFPLLGGHAPISSHKKCAVDSKNKVENPTKFSWCWEPIRHRNE